MGNVNTTAKNVLKNVDKYIEMLESLSDSDKRSYLVIKNRTNIRRGKLKIDEVYAPLSIFDWWNDNLSLSQLKQMRTFLKTAISLGFNGYVCFKVGATGCANGMWAHTDKSTDGYSPRTGKCLYHSFVCDENYFDYCSDCSRYDTWHDGYAHNYKLKDIKKLIAE